MNDHIVPYCDLLFEVCSSFRFYKDDSVITRIPCQNVDSLSIDQLRLAYGSVVRAASKSSLDDNEPLWRCLSALHVAYDVAQRERNPGRLQKLRAMMTTVVSSVPQSHLTNCLDRLQHFMQSSQPAIQRELMTELENEILHNVGDQGKQYCINWWYNVNDRLLNQREHATA